MIHAHDNAGTLTAQSGRSEDDIMLSFESVTGKFIVTVVVSMLVIQSAGVLVTAVDSTTTRDASIPQAHNQSHLDQAVPQINLVCSDKPLNISTNFYKTWDQAFTLTSQGGRAYLVKLVTTPPITDYKYAGSDNNSVVRIMCDPNKYYFLGEYVIPSKSSYVSYRPADFIIFINMLGGKESVPQKQAYRFDAGPNGVFYSQGTGNYTEGNYGWNPWVKISATSPNSMWVKSSEAIGSTSIFEQSHPISYVELAKFYPIYNFEIQDHFSLAFYIADLNQVSSKIITGSSYYAVFPDNNLGFDGKANMFFDSSVWAPVFSSYQSQTTTSQLTTQVTTSRSSIQETQTTPAQGGLSFFDMRSQNVLLIVIAIVAVLVAVCIYYRYVRKPDGQHV